MGTTKDLPAKQPARLWRALDRLAIDADWIVRRNDEIGALRVAVAQEEAVDRLAGKAVLSVYDEEVLARCHAALAVLDPSEAYEEDDPEGDLRRSVVSVRLAGLLGAFPNGSPSDPEVYTAMMLEAICCADGIGLLALDGAVRSIIATATFLPAAAEVLDVVRQQQAIWDERLWAIAVIADASRKLVARIEALQASAAERAVEVARRELIARQAAAAALAQEIEVGFERLAEATRKLQAIEEVREERHECTTPQHRN